jgi:hypothetical protein
MNNKWKKERKGKTVKRKKKREEIVQAPSICPDSDW